VINDYLTISLQETSAQEMKYLKLLEGALSEFTIR